MAKRFNEKKQDDRDAGNPDALTWEGLTFKDLEEHRPDLVEVAVKKGYTQKESEAAKLRAQVLKDAGGIRDILRFAGIPGMNTETKDE